MLQKRNLKKPNTVLKQDTKFASSFDLLYYSSMKAFYLVGSIIFTVIILIVAFQNIGTNFSGFTVFFTPIEANGTLIVFGIAILGIFAGGFYFGFLSSLLKGDQEEEEPGGIG